MTHPSEMHRHRAACANHPDPDLWHTDDNGARAHAKAVCRSCPVLAECAAWVAAHPQEHGVWAGTDPRDRRRPRKPERTHCKRGHSLHDAFLTTTGYRQCRTCTFDSTRRSRARAKAAG